MRKAGLTSEVLKCPAPKFAATAAACRPTVRPSTMSSPSAPVFTIVSVVWTHFASFTPRRLIQVRTQIEMSATRRCGVSPSWVAFAGS